MKEYPQEELQARLTADIRPAVASVPARLKEISVPRPVLDSLREGGEVEPSPEDILCGLEETRMGLGAVIGGETRFSANGTGETDIGSTLQSPTSMWLDEDMRPTWTPIKPE